MGVHGKREAGGALSEQRAGQRAQGVPRPWLASRGNRYAASSPLRVMICAAASAPPMMPVCRFEPRTVCCGGAGGNVIHHVPGLYILYCGLGPQARS